MENENLNQINQNIINIGAIIIGFILYFAFLVIPRYLPQTIGSYPAYKYPSSGELVALPRTITKVNTFNQSIIFRQPNNYKTPQKLINCIVWDKKNWLGYYSDESRMVEMRKGRIISEPVEPNNVYIGRFHWWYLRAMGEYVEGDYAETANKHFPKEG